MILVRTGGVLGVVIALMVAPLIVFVVRPGIDDTTQRAFDTAIAARDSLSPAAFVAVVTEVKREPARTRSCSTSRSPSAAAT